MHSLKNRKDFFDTDLIHLAVNGIEDEIGFRSPIICLTQDTPTEVENRLRIYKGLISYVKEQFEVEMLAAGFLPLETDLYNGRIFCFNKVGGLVRHFDVAKDITPLLFSF